MEKQDKRGVKQTPPYTGKRKKVKEHSDGADEKHNDCVEKRVRKVRKRKMGAQPRERRKKGIS